MQTSRVFLLVWKLPLHGKTKAPEFSWLSLLLSAARESAIPGLIAGAISCGLRDWSYGLAFGLCMAGSYVAWHVGGVLWHEWKHPPEGEVDAEGYRHGRWTWRDGDGNVESEIDYEHGEREGRLAVFHPNGKVAFECHYANGKLHGPERIWHTNGQLAIQCKYVEDDLDGLAVEWNEAGAKIFEGGFSSDWAHGPWTWWHDNGERWVRAEFAMGTPHGKWTQWDERGELIHLNEFVAGVQQGRSRHYFEDQSSASRYSSRFLPPVSRPARRGRGRWLWWALAAVVCAAVVSDGYLLVPLGLLIAVIFIHELGHLLAAKLVGIPIKRFRVGVGRKLWAFLYRGTVYEFCLVPLMGFVEEYALRPCEWDHARAVRHARRRKMPEPPYPEIDKDDDPRAGSYLVSPLKRTVYLLGGVGFNLIAAVLVLWALRASAHPEFGAGEPYGPVHAAVDTAEVTWQLAIRLPEVLGPIFAAETYTKYEPSMVGAISEKTRAAVEHGPASTGSSATQPVAPAARVPLADRLYFAGMEALWHFYALSLVIALFNVLPVPPLDGFHCVAALAEMVLGESLASRILRPVYWLGGLVMAFLMLSGCYLIVRDLLAAIGRLW